MGETLMFVIGVCRLGKPLVNPRGTQCEHSGLCSLARLTETYYEIQLTGNLSTGTYKSDQRMVSNDTRRFQLAASRAKALRSNHRVVCMRPLTMPR